MLKILTCFVTGNENLTIHQIAKRTRYTPITVYKKVKQMDNLGIIKIFKYNNRFYIKLTNLGKEHLIHAHKLKNILGGFI